MLANNAASKFLLVERLIAAPFRVRGMVDFKVFIIRTVP